MMDKRIIGALAFLAALSMAGSLWAKGPVLVLGHLVPTVYHHELTTAQIEAMGGLKAPSRNSQEPGLTVFDVQMAYQVGSEVRMHGKEPMRAWIKKLQVDFSLKVMEVYVSSQYPVGSCQYKAVLAHEKTHVAINQKTYRKYMAILKRELGRLALPTPARPWRVASEGEVDARAGALIQPVLDRVQAGFVAENKRLNARIDTPASYAKISRKCKGW